jgi:hypothetical protein
MQFMTKVFPVVFGVLSLRFASGLVVYWVTSNTWRIGQQHLVLNKIYDTANNAPAPKASALDDEEDPPAETKPVIRRPGSPKPARTDKGSVSGGPGAKKSPGSGGAKPPTGGPKGTGGGSSNRSNGAAGGSANGAATPASAGNRRKKRKR